MRDEMLRLTKSHAQRREYYHAQNENQVEGELKVGDTRNQYPYVSHYVSAKSGKILGFERI